MSSLKLMKGQLVKFIGRAFEGFNTDYPFMKFLGYDSNGWTDIWIEYNQQIFMINLRDIELVEPA